MDFEKFERPLWRHGKVCQLSWINLFLRVWAIIAYMNTQFYHYSCTVIIFFSILFRLRYPLNIDRLWGKKYLYIDVIWVPTSMLAGRSFLMTSDVWRFVGSTPLDSRVDAVGGGENETAIDERAATKPITREHKQCHPRPLVKVSVLPAHDAKIGAASSTPWSNLVYCWGG